MLTLYGIPNCDSCKKARKWLADNEIEHRFHDMRADGLTREHIDHWLTRVPREKLVNTRSTTWRTLPEADRNGLDEQTTPPLLLENPTLIKRPVLETETQVLVGFVADQYDKLLN